MRKSDSQKIKIKSDRRQKITGTDDENEASQRGQIPEVWETEIGVARTTRLGID
jgi:hypothetical protein